jgi:hypothetical protein
MYRIDWYSNLLKIVSSLLRKCTLYCVCIKLTNAECFSSLEAHVETDRNFTLHPTLCRMPSSAIQEIESGDVPTGNSEPSINTGLICYVDGSFSQPDAGGAAYIIYQGQVMLENGLQSFKALNPFHSELQAMKLAIEALEMKGSPTCTIFIDCMELRNILTSTLPPLDIDWRLYTQRMKIWQLF